MSNPDKSHLLSRSDTAGAGKWWYLSAGRRGSGLEWRRPSRGVSWRGGEMSRGDAPSAGPDRWPLWSEARFLGRTDHLVAVSHWHPNLAPSSLSTTPNRLGSTRAPSYPCPCIRVFECRCYPFFRKKSASDRSVSDINSLECFHF